MKIPFTNYQMTGHRPGKTAHHSPEKLEKPSTTLSDVLPLKVRPIDERATAFRIRSQFIFQARQLTALIAATPEIAENPALIPRLPQMPEEQVLSGRKNRAIAEETLKNVRLALYNKDYGSFKSHNKFYANKIKSEAVRINKGDFHNFNDVGTITNPFHKSAMRSQGIWKSTNISCSGLAYAAMDYIHYKYPNVPVAALHLSDAHALMALGELSPELANLSLGAWPEHVHVCDPWTNITCPAPEYPERFVEKMEKWNTGNKKILYNREWVNPVNPKWRACVNAVPEIYVRQGYEKGLFDDHKMIPPPVKPEG